MSMMSSRLLALLFLVFPLNTFALVEKDRLKEYHARNYTWPLPEVVPDTPGWRRLMDRRFMQIERIPNNNARYEGFLQTIHSALLAPNFTENGWGLSRAPEDLMVALRQGVREGYASARLEGFVDVIDGPNPKFIDRPDLTRRVLQELKPLHEAWVGFPLTSHRAYGFRLYGNESRLWMHVDKPTTHIVSCILHIDSSEDAEPWPILIEDFQGNTHEVLLESGDMLFYESSKCFHGRPRPFRGTYYSSIFVHYYPTEGWMDLDRKMEEHYAVPPHWKRQTKTGPPVDRLEMVGTSMVEPVCADSWCAFQDTIKWSGVTSEYGQVITTGGKKYPLSVAPSHEEL